MRVTIFYHCYPVGEWREIFGEHMGKILFSGLYDVAEAVNITFIAPTLPDVLMLPKMRFTLVKENGLERPTLEAIRTFSMASTEKEAIVYLHSKGVTSGGTNVTAWRRFMDYFIITKWKDCFRKIEEGWDCCGVNWWGDFTLDGCQNLTSLGTSGGLRQITSRSSQNHLTLHLLTAVSWSSGSDQGEPKAFSFHDNPKAFYTTMIPEEDYKVS